MPISEISIYLPGVLLAYAAFILAIASPGPNVLAVIGTSMGAGRASGIALALGIALGSLVWSTFSVLGLSAVLIAYAPALYVIKILGGAYLLWLAYRSFRSAASAQDIEAKALAGGKLNPFRYARRGFIVMITNPKAAPAWIAIISLGMQPGAPAWVGLAIIVGTFAISIVAHILYAIAFSSPVMLQAYSRARRYIQFVFGGFFVFAGFKLLSSKG